MVMVTSPTEWISPYYSKYNNYCPVTINVVTDGESSEEEKGENEPFC